MIRGGLIGLAAIAGLVASASPGHACSCMGPIAACQNTWRSDAVFVGRVVRVIDLGNGREFLSSRRVTLEVLERFRFVDDSLGAAITIDVLTGRGGGDCGIKFEHRETYLVFASVGKASAPVLRTGLCDGTREVSRAADDLTYLRSLASAPPRGGRVYGHVELSDPVLSSMPGVNRPRPKRLAGLTVTLTGPAGTTPKQTITNDAGEYEFLDLPPGQYRVDPELPEIYYANASAGWNPFHGEVPHIRGCAELNVWVAHDGRLTGRIVDARGKPIPGLSIALVDTAALDGRAYAFGDPRAMTKEDGSYEITRVPPGRYVAAVNPERDFRSGKLLLPRVLHPGVTSAGDATIIEVGLGERVTVGEWRMPPVPALIILRGKITTPDGQPAARAEVYLSVGDDHQRPIGTSTLSDAEGQFAIAAIEGQRYRVHANRTLTIDGDANEAKSDNAAKSRHEYASSEPLVAGAAMPAIVLRLTSRPARY